MFIWLFLTLGRQKLAVYNEVWENLDVAKKTVGMHRKELSNEGGKYASVFPHFDYPFPCSIQ